MGYIDTIFLLFYSIGLYICGMLGDHFDPKYMLVISYVVVNGVVVIISAGGLKNIDNIFFYIFFAILNGIF